MLYPLSYEGGTCTLAYRKPGTSDGGSCRCVR